MINRTSVNDISLTVQKGGMIAFEKTGIYPEYLVFNSKTLKRTWRVKLNSEKQQGFLRMNGVVVFNYFFDGLNCKMQELKNGQIYSEWEIDLVTIVMMD